jgi:regulatory protein
MSKKEGAGGGSLSHTRLEREGQDPQKQAWEEAIRFLAQRARSEQEVHRRLIRHHPEERVSVILARLAANGWVDDRQYACQYVNSRRSYGRRRLLQELRRKGIPPEIAQSAVSDLLSDGEMLEAAHQLAAKRLASMTGVDREKASRRLYGLLVRRGFAGEIITRVIGPLVASLPAPIRNQGHSGLRRSAWKSKGEEHL